MRRYEKQFLAPLGRPGAGVPVGEAPHPGKTGRGRCTCRPAATKSWSRGVHLPCATTLTLFLGQLSDQEVVAFVQTFAQLVETARFQEAPDAHEITQLPGESRRARAPWGTMTFYEDEDTLVNRLYYAVPSFEGGKFHCALFLRGKHLPQRGKRGADVGPLGIWGRRR